MDDAWSGTSDDPQEWSPPTGLDTSVAHSARRYNYWLGGKDNFDVDRESGDAVEKMFPTIRMAVVENRRFLARAVTMLTQELGVRQFLDIGTGLPSAGNTHQVAQEVAPDTRVVYVDNDPMVMVHARALLTSAPGFGVTEYIEADLREPEKIVQEATRTLDFNQPVALMLVAVLHFLSDEDDPYSIVGQLIDALPSGSYLAMSHATGEYLDDSVIARARSGPAPTWLRSSEQITRFFDGLELLPPGIVSTAHWRAESEPEPRPSVADVAAFGAVARIP